MNIQGSINKLLLALQFQDKFYKINEYKFFSENLNKYCTKYSLLKKDSLTEKYEEVTSTFSKIDILKRLATDYKKGSEDIGKRV